jgi:hypothetical protein
MLRWPPKHLPDRSGSGSCEEPKPDQWDAYLGYARMLRPELERIEGFVDNVRYRSFTREG